MEPSIYLLLMKVLIHRVWFQLLDRIQQKFAFVTFPLSAFAESATNAIGVEHDLIRAESTPIWYNVNNFIYCVDSQVSNLLHFSENNDWLLFTSEESGYRHIYKYSFTSKKTEQITSGEWIVDEDFIEVDTDKKLVYFTGTKDTPLEQHLYCTSYDHPSSEIFRYNTLLSIDTKDSLSLDTSIRQMSISQRIEHSLWINTRVYPQEMQWQFFRTI